MSNEIVINSNRPLLPEEIQAGEKIGKWYKNCCAIRGLESKFRTQLARINGKSTFSVNRVVASEHRKKLTQEVEATVLNFYPTDAGKEWEKTVPFAEDNIRRWTDIHKYLITAENEYLPIVVRDKQEELQAVALVFQYKWSLYLSLRVLATVPQNLGDKGRYRGAGTAAFEDAVFLAIRKGLDGIQLASGVNATDFYRKLGVQFEDWISGELPSEEFPTFLKERGGRAIPAGKHL
jgi:hypothetical protein